MKLEKYDVSVLDPIDDLTWTHGAVFVKDELGNVRRGWAMRWLQSQQPFFADTGGLRLNEHYVNKLSGLPKSDARE